VDGRHGRYLLVVVVFHSVRSVFSGISAMTRVAQHHGSKGMADQRSSPIRALGQNLGGVALISPESYPADILCRIEPNV